MRWEVADSPSLKGWYSYLREALSVGDHPSLGDFSSDGCVAQRATRGYKSKSTYSVESFCHKTCSLLAEASKHHLMLMQTHAVHIITAVLSVYVCLLRDKR